MHTNGYGDQTGSSQTTEWNKGCDLRWNMHRNPRKQKAWKKSARQTKETKKRTNEHANPTIKLQKKNSGHESGQKKENC